jgi:hypothetical protein
MTALRTRIGNQSEFDVIATGVGAIQICSTLVSGRPPVIVSTNILKSRKIGLLADCYLC